MISSDEPIRSASDDKLNRTLFVKQLSEAIENRDWTQSLAVGIEGNWGTGKTSVLNLIQESLSADITVVNFSPWYWGDAEHLHEAFFAELIEAGDFPKDTKNIIYEYAELLAPIDRRVEIVFKLLKRASRINTSKRKGIDQVKEKATKLIESSGKKFVVIIDDLDRLTPNELLEVFRLVRSNADFANTVYVLAYQRSIVIKHLNEECFPGNADKYLEKIINFPIQLPEVDREILSSILEEEISSLIDQSKLTSEDQIRLSELYYFFLLKRVNTLRDVKRLVSHIKFSCSMHLINGQYEVNLVDMLAMSSMRVFSPELYKKVFIHRKILLGEEIAITEEEKKEVIENAQSLIKKADDHWLVKFLFPDVDGIVEGKQENHNAGASETYVSKRVCHRKVFARYYQLDIPVNDVTHRAMDEFLQDITTNHDFVDKYRDTEKLDELVYRIKYYLDTSQLRGANTVYSNMLKLGDCVRNRTVNLLSGSPFDNVCYCLKKLLINERSSKSDRADAFLAAYHGTHSYSVIARYLNSEWWSKQGNPHGQESFLEGRSLESLRKQWLEDLHEMSIKDPERILAIPALEILLIQWEREAESMQQIEKWIQKLPYNKDFCIRVLDAFSKNTSRGLRIDMKEMLHYFNSRMRMIRIEHSKEATTPHELRLLEAYDRSRDETRDGEEQLEG